MRISMRIRFCIIYPIILAVTACATVEPPDRGDLSDAMRVASDNYKGERVLTEPESSVIVESDTDAVVDLEVTGSASPAVAQTSRPELKVWYKSVMITRGFGRAAGGDYQDHSSVQLSLAGEDMVNTQSEVYVGAETVSLRKDSNLYPSIKGDLDVLTAGVKLKHYFKPRSEQIRPYLSGGAGGAYMYWSYRNPYMTSNGDLITSDNLTGFTLFGAAGVEFKPARFVSLFAEVSPKIRLWNERTGKGYNNNEFNTMYLMAYSFGLAISF